MEIVIAIFAGLLCGFLNTVASSGSAVSLPLLMFLGMAPALANGTNRVPVLIAAFVASVTFIRAKIIDWGLAAKIVLPTTLGSLIGAYLADQVPSGNLKFLITIAVLIALVLLFTGLKKVLMRSVESPPRYRWQEVIFLVFVGIWLGFIVLDGSTYLLLVLILGMRLNLMAANAYKNLAIASTSAIALVIFSIDGNVDWKIGSLMAIGAIGGGFIGARVAMMPMAKVWTFRLLVTIILLEVLQMGIGYLHRSKFLG